MNETASAPAGAQRMRVPVRQFAVVILVTATLCVALCFSVRYASAALSPKNRARAQTLALLRGVESGTIGAADLARMTMYIGDTSADFEAGIAVLRGQLKSDHWEVVSAGYSGADICVTVLFSESDSESGTDVHLVKWFSNYGIMRPELVGSDLFRDDW